MMNDVGMTRLVIGNLISVAQIICLTISCCASTRRRVYLYQFTETALCAVATIFFGAWSGLSTLVIALYRNWRTMEDKFSKTDMIVTGILTVVIGIAVNTDGWIGLLPIIATLQLTAFNHYVEDVKLTRIGVLINVVMWGIYAFGIRNYVGGVGEIVTLVIGVIALMRMEKDAAYSV